MFAVATAGLLLLSGTLAGGTANAAAGPVITTIAGGDGGPGTGTSVAVSPCAVTSTGGPVYLSDGSVLRELNESTGQLVPVAGVSELGNVPGSLGNGTSGLSAWVKQGCGIAADSNGNLLYADSSTFQVRVLAEHTGSYYGQNMTSGHVYTIAGTGVSGFGGDGGPALKAELADPTGVTTDAAGNVIISDAKVARIRVVAERTGTFYGKTMTAGDIYTVVTLAGGSNPAHAALDHAGNLVIAEEGSGSQLVLQVFAATSGTFYGRAMHVGGIYTIATIPEVAGEADAAGLAVDGAGNVVVSDEDGYLVRVVAGSTGTFYGQSMKAGGLYTVAGNGQGNYNGDGIPAKTAGMQPVAVAVDSAGNLIIADANNRLRVVAVSNGTDYGQHMSAGYIYTVAGNGTADLSGNGGPATAAELGGTFPSVSDSAGNILFCDNSYQTYECHVLAARTGLFYGLQMTAGDLYTIPGVSTSSLALDTNGNVLFGAGAGQVLAAKTGFYYSLHMIAGHLYSVPALADGTIALDHYGNVTESGMGQYTGVVNIFATKTGTFYGQSMTALHVYHVAGTLTPSGSTANGVKAVNAYIGDPLITIGDPHGNLVIDDGGYNKVRVVAATSGTFYGQAMKAGDIYTIAGVQKGGSTANGIPAVQASIGPSDVAFDAAGNLVIADAGQHKVRVVATKTGTFYGQAMKAGDIYAIAGNGTPAFGGDGGSPLSASLYEPDGVTVLPDGNIIVSDSDRIRLISEG
jgi:hypothetical protein